MSTAVLKRPAPEDRESESREDPTPPRDAPVAPPELQKLTDGQESSAGDGPVGSASWRGILLLTLVGLAFLAPVGFAMLRRARSAAEASSAPAPIRVPPVAVEPVRPVEAILSERLYSGEVRARHVSDAGFESAGRVLEVLVDAGDRVKRGQALARLDDATLQAERAGLVARRAEARAALAEAKAGPRDEVIAAARAAVAELDANIRLSRLREDRLAPLVRSKAATAHQLDEARLSRLALVARRESAAQRLRELEAGTRPERLAAAAARVKALDARLAALDVAIGRTRLTAPFAGRVAARMVDPGEVAAPGRPAFRIVSSGPLEVRVGIPPEAAATLERGGELVVRVGAETARATLRERLPELDPRTRMRILVLDLDRALDAPGPFAPGQVVRVALPGRERGEGLFELPITALSRSTRGLWACLVVRAGPDGPVAERQELEVVHLADGRATVRGSLSAGDRVITGGLQRIVPGLKIRPLESSATADETPGVPTQKAGQGDGAEVGDHG